MSEDYLTNMPEYMRTQSSGYKAVVAQDLTGDESGRDTTEINDGAYWAAAAAANG